MGWLSARGGGECGERSRAGLLTKSAPEKPSVLHAASATTWTHMPSCPAVVCLETVCGNKGKGKLGVMRNRGHAGI